MYYVNEQQIESRLAFIPTLIEACSALKDSWDSNQIANQFAQERTLHLAIETVTDVGSLLIDGFIMRDASSYEDIIEILQGEQVFNQEVAATLLQLVQLRRPLVQDYVSWERADYHPLMEQLPSLLAQFDRDVRAFMQKELGTLK
jgi:uncharacterized protein YutE (UPF0331/DUF86 family)